MFLIQTLVGFITGVLLLNLWLFLVLKWVSNNEDITNIWASFHIIVVLAIAIYMLAIYATDTYKKMLLRITKLLALPALCLAVTIILEVIFN